jgi:hypothetical protein
MRDTARHERFASEGAPVRAKSTCRVRGATGPLKLQSDINADEPVSETEIRLIFSVLGDRIADILGPVSTEPSVTCRSSDE